jgi:hypothetical protein
VIAALSARSLPGRELLWVALIEFQPVVVTLAATAIVWTSLSF